MLQHGRRNCVLTDYINRQVAPALDLVHGKQDVGG
jgi:hypothetical protein